MIEAPVRLSAELIEAFAGLFLSVNYDAPSPVAPFHREIWQLYCSDSPQCACAAPRGHAKSTALTLAYGLAVVLFREQSYVVLLGSSEDMAVESLGELVFELTENEDLIAEFGIKRFITQQKTDLIVECEDGYQFRIVARGAGQKIRGRKWRGKRPGLLLFDDVEDDEQVESRDQRTKFKHWFFRAAKQSVRLGGKVRGHGTIMHEDSMLANLMKNPEWKSKVYKAHESFDDFSNILWPQRYTEALLRAKQRELVAAGDAPGYSAEMLNDPLDNSEAFLRKADFIPMTEDDHDSPKTVCAAADFATSKADLANRTSFTVGGKDERNMLCFIDQRTGRWDTKEWIDIMFEVQERWRPEVFWVEAGVIWQSIAPFIYREMQVRDVYINCEPVPSVKDKATRGRSLQRRMRAGGTRWDAKADWYAGMEQELLRFTGAAAATLDDQFDSSALLSRGFDSFRQIDEDEWTDDEEFEMRRAVPQSGRSQVTGY